MDFNKKVTLTVSFRPFVALRNLALVAMAVFAVSMPTPRMHVSAAEEAVVVPPTIEQLEFQAQVHDVELVLEKRMKSVAGNEVHETAVTLVSEARKSGFDPLFILAIIDAESGYDVEACSPSKAKGLMQILPSTFKEVSNHPKMFEPSENVRAGIKYLTKLGTTFKRPESILMAYNGGPGGASRYIKAVQAKEDTSGFKSEMIEYPGKVMGKYKQLLAKNGKDPRKANKLFRENAPVPMMVATR
jgi:soluble lytic murein transglycosylase-like protein